MGLDEGASDDDGTVENGVLVALCEDVGVTEGDAVGTSEVISLSRKSPVGPGDDKSVPVGDCVKKGTLGGSQGALVERGNAGLSDGLCVLPALGITTGLDVSLFPPPAEEDGALVGPSGPGSPPRVVPSVGRPVGTAIPVAIGVSVGPNRRSFVLGEYVEGSKVGANEEVPGAVWVSVVGLLVGASV